MSAGGSIGGGVPTPAVGINSAIIPQPVNLPGTYLVQEVPVGGLGVVVPPGTSSSSGANAYLIAALAAVPIVAGEQSTTITGGAVAGDGQGGTFDKVTATVHAVDNGAWFATDLATDPTQASRWQRRTAGRVSDLHGEMYGALSGLPDSYASLQRQFDSSFGPAGTPHGLNAHLNYGAIVQGWHNLTDTMQLERVVGGCLAGAARFATKLVGVTVNKPLVATDGFAYSTIEDQTFSAGASNLDPFAGASYNGAPGALLDLDYGGGGGGNNLQWLALRNLYFEGNGLTSYGERVARHSGAMGNGLLHTNNVYAGCVDAGYLQRSFNALANTFLTCDFQFCPKAGILVYAGSIDVTATTFENSPGTMAQLAAPNYADVSLLSAGDNDVSTLRGCRSESWRLLYRAAPHSITLDSCGLVPPANNNHWTALAVYAPGDFVTGTFSPSWGTDGKVYRCTVGGAAGAAEPAWNGGTVIEPSGLTWVYVDFYTVDGQGEGLVLRHCLLPYGKPGALNPNNLMPARYEDCTFNRSDWAYDLHGAHATFDNNMVRQGSGPASGGALLAHSLLPTSFVDYSHTDIRDKPLEFNRLGCTTVGLRRASADLLAVIGSKLGVSMPAAPGTIPADGVLPTDTAGADFYLAGGQSTGTGKGGLLRLQRALPSTTGSAANALVDIVQVGGDDQDFGLEIKSLLGLVQRGDNGRRYRLGVTTAGTLYTTLISVPVYPKDTATLIAKYGSPGGWVGGDFLSITSWDEAAGPVKDWLAISGDLTPSVPAPTQGVHVTGLPSSTAPHEQDVARLVRGINDRFAAGAGAQFDVGAGIISIHSIIRFMPSAAGSAIVLGKWQAAGARWDLYLDAAMRLYLRAASSTMGPVPLGGFHIVDSNWHSVVVTIDQAGGAAYIDSDLGADGTAGFTGTFSNPAVLFTVGSDGITQSEDFEIAHQDVATKRITNAMRATFFGA